jgi:hypothetical protein
MTSPDAVFLVDVDTILSSSIGPGIPRELKSSFKYSLFRHKILGFPHFLFPLPKIKMIELGAAPYLRISSPISKGRRGVLT